MEIPAEIYHPKNKIRIVTAASLFDGHDVSINIMRRILQSSGAEVIHLGHNRSALEVVNCAIQEDAQGIAITSYQGGHNEYFSYVIDLLKEKKSSHIKVFGGGGGVILPSEIKTLEAYGVIKIYSPDDGRRMGLQGMINDLLQKIDFPLGTSLNGELSHLVEKDTNSIARAISVAENRPDLISDAFASYPMKEKPIPVLGITGTGGSGKSSLVDELIRRFLFSYSEGTVAIISVDPSKRKSGGALLGDRIRMNAIDNDRVYMRSLATRQAHLSLSKAVKDAIRICKMAGYHLIIVETSGIGQSDSEIVEVCDFSLYVMTPEYGASSQLEKIDMIDFADGVAINKSDKKGAEDALRDVRKQYARAHQIFGYPGSGSEPIPLPVFSTVASEFNDPGTNALFSFVMDALQEKIPHAFLGKHVGENGTNHRHQIIPPQRTRYLAEIAEENKSYTAQTNDQAKVARKLYQLQGVIEHYDQEKDGNALVQEELRRLYGATKAQLSKSSSTLLKEFEAYAATYQSPHFTYEVRGKATHQPLFYTSLAGTHVPKVALPKYSDWGDILRWMHKENVPGAFPFTAGVFPLKREGEDPTRMFAGEGGPERTNKRFHYLSRNQPAKRLSTAFDSVTLYGEDPHERPDIYGKIGNAGVSVATLDDAKKLYSGFDLCDPATSVSMTINGPAPMVLAFFLLAAIDQQCERYIVDHHLEAETERIIKERYAGKPWPRPTYAGALPKENNGLGLRLLGISGDEVLPPNIYDQIKKETLSRVRGTVQADILKEDQAQNTCVFSTEFALKLMGDIQQYFSENQVKNFYSVSISGYHMAEAGANPITQLAFTLSNGFTFVEYYLSRGIAIDDFAPNLSFFFSNGIDPEYAVIGRVARRIWAKAIRFIYKGNERSQKLKYHIQTSGRSLHAQEIDFNDIRTTLQALYAIYDNCNSLHTNAFDEAITTPTENSVRRAMAIQLIINKELGLAKNENPLQGSFIIEELTDLVEEAVIAEFVKISDRGGVLGAMETMYQRNKIQEESMYYEMQKHNGDYPIVGVNTFLNDEGSPTIIPAEIIRATEDEKKCQIANVSHYQERNRAYAAQVLANLYQVASSNGNIFEHLMEASKVCSLGQITHALYAVGGQYRRNM